MDNPDATLPFRVASKLLQELGRRLVTRPASALAEVIKNAYDADASTCEVRLDLGYRSKKMGGGRMRIIDNGTGMSLADFKRFWMVIGSDHKHEERRSKLLGRSFTGSKGIGRIATNYLANHLVIRTISRDEPEFILEAEIDWNQAIDHGDITEVDVPYKQHPNVDGRPAGTTIEMVGLRQDWGEEGIEELARAVWTMEPPFRKARPAEETALPLPDKPYADLSPEQRQGVRNPKDFAIKFASGFPELDQRFKDVQNQVLRLEHAKIVGSVKGGRPQIAIEFPGEAPVALPFEGLAAQGDSEAFDAQIELRVYDVQGRQRGGLGAQEVRDYLREAGGVQIFDRGFRLAFYGERENDWLRITEDHARRLAKSSILPPEFEQVENGMQYMPTYWQVWGMVDVETGGNLEIGITRDRLNDTHAFRRLAKLVRASIHAYGHLRMARKVSAGIKAPPVKPINAVNSVGAVLSKFKDVVDKQVFRELHEASQQAAKATRTEEDNTRAQLAFLAGHATTGIVAIGFQHDLGHKLASLERIAGELKSVTPQTPRLAEIANEIGDWVKETRKFRALYAHLLDEENLSDQSRLRAAPIVDDVIRQLSMVMPGITVLNELPETVRFPYGSYIEWVSILQNVFLNASNAVQDVAAPTIVIRSVEDSLERGIHVLDNGAGMDLKNADEAFEPFKRFLDVPPERRAKGLGGTGIGLSLVRLLAQRREAVVAFRKPPSGFSTCFEITWQDGS